MVKMGFHFQCFQIKNSALVSDIAVLNGNNTFSILVLSTEKWGSSFLKKDFVFQKICFKVKKLKTFKISTDCHIKACWSRKRRAILKITGTFLKKNLCSFCWFQNQPSKKRRFSVLKQKPTQILP